MYGLAAMVIVFVLAQSLFFLIRAWKHGKEVGLTASDMKKAVTSSALFTIAPAIAIFATVVTLASTLGIVLPWIRLTVVGNLQYEVTAAQAALESFQDGLSIAVFGQNITDPKIFAAVSWVMTIGVIFSLLLIPIFLKKIQSKVGQVTNNSSDLFRHSSVMQSQVQLRLSKKTANLHQSEWAQVLCQLPFSSPPL